MVYMEPHMLGWQPLVKSWLNTLPPTLTDDYKELISGLYNRMVLPCIDFVRKAGFKVRRLKPIAMWLIVKYDSAYKLHMVTMTVHSTYLTVENDW